jgi:gliding motility-associated-like protein
MRKLLFFILFLVSTSTFASHIVGGEFELLHIAGSRYRLNLILYFDVINGNPGARDPDATVRIFRKSDNAPIRDVYIPFLQEFRVEYFQPLCSSGEIVTDKLVYSTEITLSADIYDDPGGYYISWERCCRNYTITNIFSENPQDGGNTAGQTFYLEFPPVVKNGQPFINSSPQLFPPLNDYACPNRPYWVDFTGVDVDGDSLVYSMVTPLNTIDAQAIPGGGPRPGPYPKILWRPGFSLNNIMGGSPDLTISNKGFLRVTPTKQGLYVFAVKCEEYRNGEKIGEVIRDFQMLVLDICPVADPPVIKGKMLSDTDFTYVDYMNVIFPNTVADADRCIEVEVSDPDALKAEDGFRENIRLEVIAIRFDTELDLSAMLPAVSNVVLENGSVQSFRLCFDPCPIVEGMPYTLGIIAFDDACALPLSDTLRVTVDIEPPDNTPAYFVTGDAMASVKEGDDYQYAIAGRDDEADSLMVDIITDDFNLADFGMSLDNTLNGNGQFTTTFNWATGCDIYDFTQRTNFLIKMVLNDADLCDTGDADTLTLDLEVILPPNTDPVISTDLDQLSFLHQLNEPLNFNVFGLDTDGDGLELNVVGDGFLLKDYDITFPPASGVAQVQSAFSWHPGCDNVSLEGVDNKEFTFYFILQDLDKCKFPNHDSLQVNVTIIKPANTPPRFRFVNLNDEVDFQSLVADMQVGDLLELEVNADDAENNQVNLTLLPGSELPAGATFEPASGVGTAKSVFTWGIECYNLGLEFMPRSYNISFLASDDQCFNAMSDTVEIKLNVADIKNRVAEFLPANVFTPNNDGINDFYSLPDLPLDDCTGRFKSFRVFNRWGTEVYVTLDRAFKWDAGQLEAGVYYYTIEFTNKDYNGTISVIY